jgi:hypothetical protein
VGVTGQRRALKKLQRGISKALKKSVTPSFVREARRRRSSAPSSVRNSGDQVERLIALRESLYGLRLIPSGARGNKGGFSFRVSLSLAPTFCA